MKKYLLVLLALVLILTACAPAVTPTAVPTEEVAPATEPPAAEPTSEVVPTEVVATEAPTAVAPTEPPEPKKITMGIGFEGWPVRGWSVETDDAFMMNSNGVCETLVWVDFSGTMVPNLALSWQLVDDTTWEFKLRPDVTFQNGEPFNAAAVVKSLQYIQTSPTPPRGFSASTFSSVEAVGEDTVLVKTATKDVLMPARLTSPNTCIFAPSAYKDVSGPIDPFATGTGPFIISEVETDISITLVKNPNWWGGPINIDEVTLLYIPDAAIRAGMLQSGEINMSINIPIEQLPVLQAEPNLTVFTAPETRTTTMHMNMSREPFSDVRVRQAISYAIDTQLIVDSILEGVGQRAIGPFSPSEAWFNTELAGYSYDLEKAKALLAEAGYEAGELTIELITFPSRSILPPMAVIIQDMLADIGINVEIRIAIYDAVEPDILAGNYDMFLTSRNHALDTYDPEGFLTSDYSCEGSFNQPQFCNEEFDALLVEARATDDAARRIEIYRQLQVILEENAPSVFVHYNVRTGAYSNNVLNFQNHPLGRYYVNATLDIAP